MNNIPIIRPTLPDLSQVINEIRFSGWDVGMVTVGPAVKRLEDEDLADKPARNMPSPCPAARRDS